MTIIAQILIRAIISTGCFEFVRTLVELSAGLGVRTVPFRELGHSEMQGDQKWLHVMFVIVDTLVESMAFGSNAM